MSALLHFGYVVLASWCVLAAAGSVGWCAVLALYRRRRPATVRASYPPPVPAPLPRPESDAHWIPGWMSGAHLIDVDAVHGLLSEEQVFPTVDDAEAAVYKKLFDHLISTSWPLERQDGAA